MPHFNFFWERGGAGRLILEDFFCIAYSRTDTGACSVIRGGGGGGGWWSTDFRGFFLHCILKD